MSAVAEPPAAVQAEAVQAEGSRQPVTPQNPLKLELGGIVANLNKAKAKELPTPPAVEAKKEEAKPAEVKKEAEPIKQEPAKDEPKEKAPESAPEIKHNREHFKKLEEDRDSWKAKYEELQKQPKAEIPPDVATKLSDYEKRLEEATKEREELRSRVRAIDITQDPEFNRQYTEPVVNGQKEVFELLVRGGVDPKEAQAAVTQWDDNAFQQVTDAMPDIQKRRVDAAILETERLAKLRNSQITKPEDWQAKQRQQAEEGQKRSVAERLKWAEEIERGAMEAAPGLADEGNIEMVQAMRNAMTRAAKLEMTPKEMLSAVGQAHALQVAVKGQHAALLQMQTDMEAKDKKIAELEAFVKENGGATLRSETGTPEGSNGKYVPITERIVVRT